MLITLHAGIRKIKPRVDPSENKWTDSKRIPEKKTGVMFALEMLQVEKYFLIFAWWKHNWLVSRKNGSISYISFDAFIDWLALSALEWGWVISVKAINTDKSKSRTRRLFKCSSSEWGKNRARLLKDCPGLKSQWLQSSANEGSLSSVLL